jgi:LysR family nitrogen assimilation transcriptional regulator
MTVSNLTARQLEAIVTVAARRNISHAALELDMSQPALSRLISRLESDLDAELFIRDGRGVTPTDAGIRLVGHASEALRHLNEMEDEIRSLDGDLRGRICVAMPDTVGHALFLPLIDRVKSLHPRVELRVMGAHPNNVPLAMSAGDGDVGIVSDAHKYAGLQLTALVTEQLHLVGPADWNARASMSIAAMSDTPLALPAIQPGLRELIERVFASQGIRPNVVMELDSQDALIEVVRSGRAFSIMSFAGVLRPVRRKELVATPIIGPSIERGFHTALPEGRPVTRLMRIIESIVRDVAVDAADEARWTLSTPS